MMSNFNQCPNCGSHDLILLDEKNRKYKCHACLSIFEKSDTVNKKPQKESPSKTKSFFDNLMNKTIELHAFFDNEVVAGTGFFVSKEYVLTNAHVIMRDKKPIFIGKDIVLSVTGNDYYKNHIYDLDIVTADLEIDIAILKVQNEQSAFVNFSQNIYNGQPIYAIGNSHGEGLCIVEGIISDVSRQIENRELFMTTALATKGNSGCPVFNLNGELLGMITEASKKSIAMVYAIPSKVLLDFIRKAEIKEGIKII